MTNSPAHPGHHVRDHVLPPGMTVTVAARTLGIGRQALSNFLNANAAISTDMAARLERSFGIKAKELLDMQAAYDAFEAKAKGAPASAKLYVPPFLSIKANDIIAWADHRIATRSRLAVFLRTLVHSTGAGLSQVQFHGNDDAERPGWDGYIDASEGTPWIPAGKSGWEFGCNQDPKQKADNDYDKSVAANDKAARAETTFVFVTPRRWEGKDKWQKAKRAKKEWKNVIAMDASDLEQWVEQSIAAQVWFSNETQHPSGGVKALDESWKQWASVTEAPLVPSLFEPSIRASRQLIEEKLSGPPQQIVITADSIGEAEAFVAALFDQADEKLASYRDRIAVFEKPGVLSKLAAGASKFIPVITSREVEREFAPYAKQLPAIVIYPRNSAGADPHVTLEPLSFEAFSKSLEEMGFNRDKIDLLSKESGRSLTVLRRRLATVPAIRTPDWAERADIAQQLVPLMLAGTWNSSNKNDQAVISLLASNVPYDAIEKQARALSLLNDAPIWIVGSYLGVISKIDILFAIRSTITATDLETYFTLAQMVLSEDDPALDLSEDKRAFAGMYGKSRDTSAALREGICETLVLLGVHGNNLFKASTGIDVEQRVVRIVREILSPLTTRKLEAQERDLPTYAEATPEEFLKIIESDLNSENPACFGVMRPAGTPPFAGCPRTGLLWALENIGWNPSLLPRVAIVLARLAQIEISDNWVNRPINSLESMFRWWMPQTAATMEQRLQIMKRLAQEFPAIAWKLCVDQLDGGHRTGHYSHKPRWRTDAHGHGNPDGSPAAQKFLHHMVEMVLDWPTHSRSTICDLIGLVPELSEDDQRKVWEIVRVWADTQASDLDKAWLREKIRTSMFSRRGLIRAKRRGSGTSLRTAAKAAFDALQPSDLLNRHEWLFRKGWLDESADELEDEEIDYNKREERIAAQRTQALKEIFEAKGLSGILTLTEMGEADVQIGLLCQRILSPQQIASLIVLALSEASSEQANGRRNLVRGLILSLAEETRAAVLADVKGEISEDAFSTVLTLAPFASPTWSLVDELQVEAKASYWQNVSPGWILREEQDLDEGVERLMSAGRPRAAFNFAHFELKRLKPSLLFSVLMSIAKGSEEPTGHYQLEEYYVDEAFKALNGSGEFNTDQMASLEYAYVPALTGIFGERNESYGIPNLEKHIEQYPVSYVQAVALTYKRSDDAEDPIELQAPSPEARKSRAEISWRLLEGMSRIPGTKSDGSIDEGKLKDWVNAVRSQCKELARLEVCDLSLGKLLSTAPLGKDGVWPCEPVRNVLEQIQSEDIARGLTVGLYNSRGVHWRGEDGTQERELAAKYRGWSIALEYTHPFVASHVHKSMADSYQHDANREDTEAGIRRRLGH